LIILQKLIEIKFLQSIRKTTKPAEFNYWLLLSSAN